MALSRFKLDFTKNWENPSDFPTYQNNETQVRADLQYLFNEIRTAFNNFLSGAKAVDLPFEKTSAVDATNVQAAIENVQGQIAGVTAGAIPDNSIETAKYKDESVTASKLDVDPTHNDPVTPATIGAAAVAHDHDDRYYTEAEITSMLETDIQPNTAVLANMEGDLADNDLFPLRDQSEAASMRMTWSYLKAQMKAYMDTLYSTLSHASRHAPDGADPILVKTGNLDTGAVTDAKLATDSVRTAKIKNGEVTQAKLAANAVSSVYTGTLSATWTASGGAKYSDASISGLLTTDTIFVDLNETGTTAATITEKMNVWSEIYRFTIPSNGTLRAWATSAVPAKTCPVKVIAIRK